MIEYSMDLSTKLSDLEALRQKTQLRLSMSTRTIPYYNKGIEPFLFTYEDGSYAIRDALSDLNIRDISYDSENKRVKVMNIEIKVDQGAIK